MTDSDMILSLTNYETYRVLIAAHLNLMRSGDDSVALRIIALFPQLSPGISRVPAAQVPRQASAVPASKSTWCLTSTETTRLIRDGEKGGRGYGGGGRERLIYLSLHCHHQNDFCIKMGSDESRFNVSLIVRDKVTRQCPQTTIFLKRKESRSGIEPRSFRLPAYRLTARPNRLSSS